MWLLNDENELINLSVFIALRLEPVPDGDNLYCLVGVLGGEGEGGDSEEDEEQDSDEAFVQLSPPLPKVAADALFNATITKLAPVRVREFLAPAPRPQRPQNVARSRTPHRGSR